MATQETILEFAKKVGAEEFGMSAQKLLKYTKGVGVVTGILSAGISIYDLTQNPTSPGAWTKAIVNTTLVVANMNPAVGIITGILDATHVTDKVYKAIDEGMKDWKY